MRRLLLLVAVAALAVISLPASLASASSGTWMITTDTTLTEDHFGSVVIAADNVTLDCAGFRIVGPGEFNDGVTVLSSGVTVKNCTVTGFDGGFNIRGSENTFVGNEVINTPNGNGFGVGTGDGSAAVTGNTLVDNTATGGIHGFYLVNTSGNRLGGNTASDASVGIQVNGSGGENVLQGNTVTGNDYGIMLAFGTRSNTLSGNTATDNRIGIILEGSGITGNLLVRNTARDNDETGILLAGGTSRNVLLGNTATDNTEIGFWLAGASRNTLTLNTATGNGTSGTWEWLPSGFLIDSWGDYPADNNVLTGNVANGNSLGFQLAGHDEDLAPVSGNAFRANTANGNTWHGFGAWRATGNTWQDNTANDNGHWGFALYNPCLTNTLTGNVGRRNGEFDAYDDDIPMLNTWTNNKFAKTSPKGL